MWSETVTAGTKIIEQGDTNSDYMYIVMEGEFEVIKEDREKSAENVEATAATEATLSKGSIFGELALLYFKPRAATVYAKTNASVMVLDRISFKDILQKDSDALLEKYIE